MKTIINSIISISLTVALALPATASAAMLAWDANTDPVDGYKIHYGTSPSRLSQTIDVKKATSYNLDQLKLPENGRYYFSVSAYNDAGESPLAPAVIYEPTDTTPPGPPQNLIVIAP